MPDSTADAVQKMRTDYGHMDALREADVAGDPIEQFHRWMDDVMKAKVAEPNAMTVATVDTSGAPSARVVLLRGFDARGFVFYTNYDSRKGEELAKNSRAALCFFWQPLERQVRVEGNVSKIETAESEKYFQSRPIKSQIGAWASPQSQPIESRDVLEKRLTEVESRFGDRDVLPLPPNWGGYRVSPTVIEFWQGGRSRLHDRLVYRRGGDSWTIQRLAP